MVAVNIKRLSQADLNKFVEVKIAKPAAEPARGNAAHLHAAGLPAQARWVLLLLESSLKSELWYQILAFCEIAGMIYLGHACPAAL